jgi:hypothetical protein
MSGTINTTDTWYENFSLAGEGEVIVHETCPTCNHTKTFMKVSTEAGPSLSPVADEPSPAKPTSASVWRSKGCRRPLPVAFKPTKKGSSSKK